MKNKYDINVNGDDVTIPFNMKFNHIDGCHGNNGE